MILLHQFAECRKAQLMKNKVIVAELEPSKTTKFKFAQKDLPRNLSFQRPKRLYIEALNYLERKPWFYGSVSFENASICEFSNHSEGHKNAQKIFFSLSEKKPIGTHNKPKTSRVSASLRLKIFLWVLVFSRTVCIPKGSLLALRFSASILAPFLGQQ